MVTTRKKRKPAPQEQIYSSITGSDEKIRTHQKINELLCKYRAEFLGITIGERFYEHPLLKDFYKEQWGDISNAIRRYGGRNVVTAIEMNTWICNPKYGDRPLRIRKFNEAVQALLPEKEPKQPKRALPKQHIPETPKRRGF